MKEYVSLEAMVQYKAAHVAFDAKRFDEASTKFKASASILYDNIDILDVNKETVDSWLEQIKAKVKTITSDSASQLDDLRNKMHKIVDEHFDERIEQIAIKLLVDSYVYAGLSEVLKNKKSGGGGGWTQVLGWIIGYIVIRAIISAFSGN